MKLISPKAAVAVLHITLSAAAIAADLHVPADYPTIQAAVDTASTGDTIHVAAGVYLEQVRIVGKSITLLGEPGAIIRATPDMEPALEEENITRRSLVLVLRCTETVIRHFTFEGDQLGNQQADTFNGALILDSGGAIEDCRFVGIREKTPGPRYCEAIEVLNDLPEAVHLAMSIRRNTIVDCYSGIRILGKRSGISLTVSVTDNIISGVGPTTTSSDLEGIEVQEGIIGEVLRNSVSGMSYIGDGIDRLSPLAFGYLGISTRFPENIIPLQPVRFAHNTSRNNQVHFAIALGDGSSIHNNRLEGTAPGMPRSGIWFTGQNVEVHGNDFRDMPEGIRVGGVDPDFGTVLGFAENAQLSNNRFRDVATPVEVQPQATAAEGGSLHYPFPAPEPTFEKALLISWPSYYDDWKPQHSTDMENWNLLDLPVLQHDGRSMITVPADEDHEFFRLREVPAPQPLPAPPRDSEQ